MVVHTDILSSLKLTKGNTPLDEMQFATRIQAYSESIWPWRARRKAPTEFPLWEAEMAPTLAEAISNNLFNYQLAVYRKATERLARYQLSVGRTEQTEMQETGERDPDTFEPTLASVVIAKAVDPLDATVEQTTFDEEGVPTTATVPNPLIVADDDERGEAQAVVDATPQPVHDFTS